MIELTETEKLQKIGILYYLRNREDVHSDMFEPMSKSQWILFREISPGKISKNHDAYVEDCNRRYLEELRLRTEVSLELASFGWNLHSLKETQKEIIKIQESDGFIKWVSDDFESIVNDILKMK